MIASVSRPSRILSWLTYAGEPGGGGPRGDQAAARVGGQGRGGEVLADRQRREDRLLTPVPGHVGDPDRRTVLADGPAFCRPVSCGTAEPLEVLVLTLAFQAGQADDLPGAQGQGVGRAVTARVGVAEDDLARPGGGVRARGGGGAGRRGRRCRVGARLVLDQVLAAGHQRDELAERRLVAVQGGHRLAGAEHGDPVGDLGHLVHPVRDEQHRRAGVGQPPDHGEQAVPGGDVERRARLVEDEHLGRPQQRPADGDGLPLAQRQRSGRGGKQRVRALAEQFGEHGARPVPPLAGGFTANRAWAVGGPGPGTPQYPVRAKPEVVEDRLAGHGLHLLEHGCDAGRRRRARRACQVHGLSIEQSLG